MPAFYTGVGSIGFDIFDDLDIKRFFHSFSHLFYYYSGYTHILMGASLNKKGNSDVPDTRNKKKNLLFRFVNFYPHFLVQRGDFVNFTGMLGDLLFPDTAQDRVRQGRMTGSTAYSWHIFHQDSPCKHTQILLLIRHFFPGHEEQRIQVPECFFCPQTMV